ncbi:hypothetical protein [Thalassomonas sp. RHCl1]|uniref:hypothetical protein n=1 Tax=Thalassomonas sp. RHCl1 TaxID=2995320 RepID=UPI00248BCFF4|nr:hypothetical protein [Thalassomonas sp. RHCl1]
MENIMEFLNLEMDASIALSIIGSSLSAGSIVMVYIMFSLQRWTEKVNALLEQSITMSTHSAPKSVDRKLMTKRISEMKGRYPLVSVLLFAAIIITLFTVGIVAAIKANTNLSFLLTGTPQIVFLLAYIASCLTAWTKGHSDLEEASEYLGVKK